MGVCGPDAGSSTVVAQLAEDAPVQLTRALAAHLGIDLKAVRDHPVALNSQQAPQHGLDCLGIIGADSGTQLEASFHGLPTAPQRLRRSAGRSQGMLVSGCARPATICSSGRPSRPTVRVQPEAGRTAVSYTHLRAHETRHDLVCRLLL